MDQPIHKNDYVRRFFLVECVTGVKYNRKTNKPGIDDDKDIGTSSEQLSSPRICPRLHERSRLPILPLPLRHAPRDQNNLQLGPKNLQTSPAHLPQRARNGQPIHGHTDRIREFPRRAFRRCVLPSTHRFSLYNLAQTQYSLDSPELRTDLKNIFLVIFWPLWLLALVKVYI
jgi:hypothetical protein